MATGGVDLQMDNISTETITLRPGDHDGVTDETSFSNPVLEDKDGYKPVDDRNLSTGDTFKTPVSFPGEGTPLSGDTAKGATRNKPIYITSLEGYTNVTKKEINNALISSRTRWIRQKKE